MKKYQRFLSEFFQFLKVKFSTYLHRRVFVMTDAQLDQDSPLFLINVCKVKALDKPAHFYKICRVRTAKI